jgi:hypothetical protein
MVTCYGSNTFGGAISGQASTGQRKRVKLKWSGGELERTLNHAGFRAVSSPLNVL